ncbi:hypothetical protein M8009_18325 [Halomonas sp. ATCH28]|uniref:Uncharacterized protein n=1 Tax=Halomonas gemina TaxID=2945105 RepID=A0ABT0T678_9GAMM|nr:hypothetical protein [Halomonas gemina]MCL7942239.1 hypothetical protein [Halomonas gemina]
MRLFEQITIADMKEDTGYAFAHRAYREEDEYGDHDPHIHGRYCKAHFQPDGTFNVWIYDHGESKLGKYEDGINWGDIKRITLAIKKNPDIAMTLELGYTMTLEELIKYASLLGIPKRTGPKQ